MSPSPSLPPVASYLPPGITYDTPELEGGSVGEHSPSADAEYFWV